MKNKKIVFIFTAVIFIIAGAALICLFLLKNIAYKNPAAYVYQNGVLIEIIDLNAVDEPYEITLTGENGETNIISVKKGEIAVTDANCPDHICVKTGYINNGALPIICLPNRVEIRIDEKNNGIDAVSR